jgi:hypothetical protein
MDGSDVDARLPDRAALSDKRCDRNGTDAGRSEDPLHTALISTPREIPVNGAADRAQPENPMRLIARPQRRKSFASCLNGIRSATQGR